MSLPRLTDEIGRVIGGRYRLITAVGAGPSAQVFLADDIRLRRRVAVKVLQPALAGDKDFAKRFRVEVQLASSLRHPHIAVVHDWGDDDGIYVVTEYLAGGSLGSILDDGLTVSPSQALQMGLAAARALDFAHSRGVVHRDLKPSNLLFAEDGRLRVGDFGLARALAEAAWTEPQGSLLGSVRYAAPEQAKGLSVDGRADVYSLALIIIEAVTGHIPFVSDTTISTLMARVDKQLAVPEELGALTGALERAGRPDPDDRLDAAGLVTALMAVAGELPEPDSLPLVPAILGGVDGNLNADRTSSGFVSPQTDDITVVHSAPASALANVEPGEPSPESPVEPALARSASVSTATLGMPSPSDATAPVAVAAATGIAADIPGDKIATDSEPLATPGDSNDTPSSDVLARNHRRWRRTWILFFLVVVLGGGGVGLMIANAQRTPVHPVPKVLTLTEPVAQQRLESLGFEVSVARVRRDGSTKGEVLGSRPVVGTRLAEGKRVTLVVSDGQTMVTLPTDVAGGPLDAVTQRLRQLGFVVTDPLEVHSENTPAGVVIGFADGTAKSVEKGGSVTLVVSSGPAPRIVPNVTGMSPDAASSAIEQVGLVPQVEKRLDIAVDKGGLIGLEPGSGASLPKGAVVKVVASSGLLVKVPDLGGSRTLIGAISQLEGAGLTPGSIGGSGRLLGQPVAYSPATGTLVAKGSSVDIVVN